MKIAIHAVFILKENILFLEEWIEYHILSGFNKFYLYDNSKINKITGFDLKHINTIIPGKVNKYGNNYDKIVNMTDKQIDDFVKKLCDKYKCIEIIEWSPKDEQGNVLYNQVQAHNHCLKTLKEDNIDWCASIDIDEYIVIKDFDNISKYILSLPPNIKNINLGQIRLESRYRNLDKLVADITNSQITDFDRNHSNKNIFKVKDTLHLEIHSVKTTSDSTGLNVEYRASINEIWFNHYKLNSERFKHDLKPVANNINPKIKNKLNKDSYIPVPYNNI